MIKTSELQAKEVININDGQRLGMIKDIELDLAKGKIKSIVVPGERKFLSIFSGKNDLVINWRQIEKIGQDVILVDLNDFIHPDNNQIE
ncbi:MULTISPECIES: YlmC/YmxH family sporulation protein [unclassified Candidatus Frackibacter]|uniref:YlmC/YmxH family sporulation protein n=1 Tax=unclassified Candidatus Frackibacter TaxID=2648818 RepID=UPI0008D3CAF0|nr:MULTISPECIES: YlmC/YmxH family sporulation protein [unclassified Candidatus Frackibacter]SEM28377.1 sporulation protein, YlmC/YmxH family [Candidatus Frackibacter sp. WG12]SFL33275.1 sporulation protein, YlmC/YmxH family [Candidatus Frackibacter sp. WG13]